MTTLYQIPCPIADNAGVAYKAIHARKFRHDVARLAGGYTLLAPSTGFWRDPESGKDYVEAVELIQFACDRACAHEIVNAFKREYPDQLCVMLASIGEAEFYPTRLDTGPQSETMLQANRHDRGWPR